MKREDSFKLNALFAVISNLTVATVSALITFILPKFLGVEEYGYWQLFVFYGSYSLLLQLGAGDGVNLRYAGSRESDLSIRGLGLQTVIIFLFTVTVCVCLFIVFPYFVDDESRLTVLRLTAIYAMVVNLRHFVLLQMQAIGNFRLYSKVTIFDRLIFIFLVVLLLTQSADYIFLAAAEIVSKVITLLVALIAFRKVLTLNVKEYRKAFRELARNVTAGLKLTIANTSNMFILGIARILIDRTFGVAVFGAISLVLNLSAFFMIFMKSIGVVLLPTLRRSKSSQLPSIYENTRLPLSIIPLLLLIVVYPMTELFSYWLPDYRNGIQYLAILMPMIVFESKMTLLVDPFLKSLRKENLLLLINLSALALSLVLAVLSSVIFNNLDLAILSIIVSLGFRSTLAEVLLIKILKIKIHSFVVIEFFLAFFSIFLNFWVGGWAGMGLMSLAIGIYILIFRRLILLNSKSLKRMISGTAVHDETK